MVNNVNGNVGRITVAEATERLYSKRILLLIIVACSAALALIVSFQISPRYRATTKLVIVQNQSSSPFGNLGSVAGSFGIDFGQSSSPLSLYSEYVFSNDLLRELVRMPVSLSDGSESTMLSLWGEGDSEEQEIASSIEAMANSLQVRTKSDAGVLEISVDTFDPEVSAFIAQVIAQELNEFSSGLRRWKGKNQIESYDIRIEEVASELRADEDSLAAFRMANVDLSNPRLGLQELRLIRSTKIRAEVLQSLRIQKEVAYFETQNFEPTLKVLETARPSIDPVWPRRGRIVFLSVIAAFVLGAYFIIGGALFKRSGQP